MPDQRTVRHVPATPPTQNGRVAPERPRNGSTRRNGTGRGRVAARNDATPTNGAPSTNGAPPNGTARNGAAPRNGTGHHGPAVNGAGVNGTALNGAAVNGAPRNEAANDGPTASEETAYARSPRRRRNGSAPHATTTNGSTANGSATNGRDASSTPTALNGKPAPRTRRRPPVRHDDDAMSLTTELEPVTESAMRGRRMDNTLARFAAVHEEIAEEERQRRSKKSRYLPWVSESDALDEALTFSGPQSSTTSGSKTGLTRLRAKKERRSARDAAAWKFALIVLAILVLVALVVTVLL